MSSDHPWFAVHDEVLNDNKLARVRRATRQHKLVVVGAWTTLLALSNQSPVRGVLLIREDRPLTTQEIFDEWDMDGGEGQTLLDTFVDQGLVAQEGGAWVICNWEKRQPKQDKSTERVRRWRERNAAANSPNSETDETFRNGFNETLRNDTEIEEEIEYIEREKGGESEGADDDDLYSFERKLDTIVAEGVNPAAGSRPRDPDDAVINAIWARVLQLCDGDIDHAGGVTIVTHELVSQLEWVKPFPRNKREFEDALTNWWQPIKQVLAGRGWDRDVAVKVLVAAAKSMQKRDLSPGCPRAVMQELSKQKAAARASPASNPSNGDGNRVGGLAKLQAKIRQKGVEHGRDNGAG